jgi:hypothetical protein
MVGIGLALAVSVFVVPAAAFGAAVDSKTSTATVAFKGGRLTLDATPNFNFGTHTIDGSTIDFPAQAKGTATIKDMRGTRAGYHLTAQLGAFSNGGTASLTGAQIVLSKGSLSYGGGGTAPAAPVAESSVRLIAGGAVMKALNAATSTGSGHWDISWNAADSVLTVPVGEQVVGSHTAVITWALTDAPA